jgi:GxxExxY protein
MDGGDARLLEPVTGRIIGCAFWLPMRLGRLVELVCENALIYEMRKSGLGVGRQRGIVVFYDGVIVGDEVIFELKVDGVPSDVRVQQCRNDLRATGKPLCLLMNFGRARVPFRRITAQANREKNPPSSRFIRLQKEAPTAGRHCADDAEPEPTDKKRPLGCVGKFGCSDDISSRRFPRSAGANKRTIRALAATARSGCGVVFNRIGLLLCKASRVRQ